MIEIIIIIVIILFLLTLTMFFMLSKIVKKVNTQSKEFFTLKLQDYDDLVEERESKLNSIKEEQSILEKQNILEEEKENKEKKENQSDLSFLENIPEYQENSLFEKMKKIDSKFQISISIIVEKFVNDANKTNNQSIYNELLKTKDAIKKIGIYEILTDADEEKTTEFIKKIPVEIKKVLREYANFEDSFSVEELLNFIELEIEKNNPIIKIETGEKNLAFSNPNIRVVYNSKIYRGIIIYYKNKRYDYSLS